MLQPNVDFFNENILPIVNKIDNLLKNEKVEIGYGLLALATILGKTIGELSPGTDLEELLKAFVHANIEMKIRDIRESN